MIKEMVTTFLNIKHNGITWTIRSEYLTPIVNEFVKKLDSKCGMRNTECGELKGQPPESPFSKGELKGVVIPQSALRNPNSTDGVRIIKSNKARTTLSAPFVDDQRVVVKRYHNKGWFERIKYLFRPSRAKAEWDTMNALLDKGISTCVPLAYGERRRWGFLLDGSLIVKEIPDCLSFQAYIKRHCSGMLSKNKILLKRELLKKLADFIRHVHEKNIDHRDFHGGNILVTETDSGDPVFYLIDLHKARVCRRLSLRRKINNLALQCDIPGFSFSKTDCLRLIKYYNNFRDKKDFKSFALKVLKKAEILKNKRLKSTTRWCLKLSNVFAVYKSKGIRIHYRKEYKLADILDLLRRVGNYSEGLHRHNIITTTPQSPPSQGGREVTQFITTPYSPPSQGGDKGEVKQILKRSSKAVVFVEEIPFGRILKKVVVKYNFDRGFFVMLKRTLFGTRGRRAWIAGNGLIVRGIPTPQPIALIERTFFGFPRGNFLLTEYIDGSLRVSDYVSKYFNNELFTSGRLEMIKKKRCFIEELARLVRHFHDTGIYHGDLTRRNILVREAWGGDQRLSKAGRWEIFIVDLDAVSLRRKLTFRRRLRHLSTINCRVPWITNTDRMRFFKTYFRGIPPKAREYAKEIVKQTRERRLRALRGKCSRLVHSLINRIITIMRDWLIENLTHKY